MPTGASAPKGGDQAETPSSRSGSGSSEGAAPAALAPGPRERRHIEHLTGQGLGPHSEPEPEPGHEPDDPEAQSSDLGAAPEPKTQLGEHLAPPPTPQATAEEGVPGEKEMKDGMLSLMAGFSKQAMSHMRSLPEGDCAAFVVGLIAQHDASQEAKAAQQHATHGLMRNEGADPPPGYTEGDLRAAAQAGDLGKTSALLDAGLNPNAVAEMLGGWPPLHFAAKGGHTAAVSELLKHGADPFARDREGETALTQARYWGHEATAAVLDEAEVRALAADASAGERSAAAECVLLPAQKVVAEAPQRVPVAKGAFAELD
eukprot:COSAG04_NODE_1363_length_7079_cov_19.484815_10_plen_315_part_01